MLFSFIFSYLESFFVVFCLSFLSYSGAGDLRARPLLTHVVEGVPTAPTRDTPRLAWGLIGGIAPGWTSATLRRTVMVGLWREWCFSCLIDKNLSSMELGFQTKAVGNSTGNGV